MGELRKYWLVCLGLFIIGCADSTITGKSTSESTVTSSSSSPGNTLVISLVTDFPAFTSPRKVTTNNTQGKWQTKDNMGDGQMGILRRATGDSYMLIMREGTYPTGAVIWIKPYDGDPYQNWGTSSLSNPIKGLPGIAPYSHGNIDTHAWADNPVTQKITAIHGSRPGSLPPGATGQWYASQRAVAKDIIPGIHPENWQRFPNELFFQSHPQAAWEAPFVQLINGVPVYSGLVAEASIFYEPDDNEMVIFYAAETLVPPGQEDPYGQRFRSRIGKITAPAQTFETNPVLTREPPPGPNSYVFAPDEDPNYCPGCATGEPNYNAVWGTANTVLQPHISRSPFDGVYHMVALGKRPNTGRGIENKTTGIGHWYSLDKGMTWTQDKNNPLVDWNSMGWSLPIANKLNSPHLMWDEKAGKVYLVFWGNDAGQNKEGTAIYMMETQISPK